VSQQTLRQRLREQGFLASLDAGRQMLQGAPDFGRRPWPVLHPRTRDVLLPTEEGSPRGAFGGFVGVLGTVHFARLAADLDGINARNRLHIDQF